MLSHVPDLWLSVHLRFSPAILLGVVGPVPVMRKGASLIDYGKPLGAGIIEFMMSV